MATVRTKRTRVRQVLPPRQPIDDDVQKAADRCPQAEQPGIQKEAGQQLHRPQRQQRLAQRFYRHKEASSEINSHAGLFCHSRETCGTGLEIPKTTIGELPAQREKHGLARGSYSVMLILQIVSIIS